MNVVLHERKDRARPRAGRTVGEVPLSPETRRTLAVSVLEGVSTSVFLTWTAGAVLTGYMLHLGAGPMDLALVASVPLLAQVTAPLAAWIQGIAPSRKGLTVATTILGRGAWILGPLVPLLALPPSLTPPLFLVGLVLFSSVFQSWAGAIWTSWMGDVVPEKIRGRYFGIRGGIVGVVVLLANLGAGRFLDSVEAPGSYQLVIVAGLVFAAVGIYLYTLQHEPPMRRSALSLWSTIRLPFKDPNFRRFLRFAVYWQAAVFLAAPFVYPYFLDHLKLTYTQIAIWAAIASSLALVFGPLWGLLADRVGNKAILAITTFLAGTASPITWMLATPGDPTFIWINGILDALIWSAATPAMLNLALVTAPRENRIAYLAVQSMLAGVSGFAAGIASGFLLRFFHGWAFTLFGYEWSGYHWVFLLAMVARMNAWMLIRPIRETNAWRTRDVLRGIRQWRLGWFPWR